MHLTMRFIFLLDFITIYCSMQVYSHQFTVFAKGYVEGGWNYAIKETELNSRL